MVHYLGTYENWAKGVLDNQIYVTYSEELRKNSSLEGSKVPITCIFIEIFESFDRLLFKSDQFFPKINYHNVFKRQLIKVLTIFKNSYYKFSCFYQRKEFLSMIV